MTREEAIAIFRVKLPKVAHPATYVAIPLAALQVALAALEALPPTPQAENATEGSLGAVAGADAP